MSLGDPRQRHVDTPAFFALAVYPLLSPTRLLEVANF
jgi:hypothetical protein